jgi:hypothetical protein
MSVRRVSLNIWRENRGLFQQVPKGPQVFSLFRGLLIRPDWVDTEQSKSNCRSFDFAPHPSDEDLSLGTPVALRKDDKGYGANLGDGTLALNVTK